ncbi:translocation/assembly module TamB domain-containing protein [Paraflavisolibacter sp. H34]|uniref:translocation/assembly module TamB domain-containing protein n=1 Tax=Huijunlia imazamoxiresistens TaxID=3127457 RepID=UPI0030198213
MEQEAKKPREVRKPNVAGKVARVLLKVVLFLLLFVVIVFLLVLTPPVQRFLTAKAETFLQNKLKTRVEIGSVTFGLSGRVKLNDIYIEDQTKDTLLSGGTIKANVTLMKLFDNEVEVKDVELKDITAKIKRVLPDTAFNFQFIADAFMTENTKSPDTAQTAPLKLSVNSIDLSNIRLLFRDVITGNDMTAHIGGLVARIDSLNPYQPSFGLRSLSVNGLTARIKQTKPLLEPDAPSEDVAEAVQPITAKLAIGDIDLNKIDLQYANDVSAFYTNLVVGKLHTTGKNFDLQNNVVQLEDLVLNNTTADIRLGKKPGAQVVKKEIQQEVEAQKQAFWRIRVDDIKLNNNNIKFDDDNQPRLAYGMDYAHLDADSLTLHMQDFVMNTDSIGGQITRGFMREKSGFKLDALEGKLLYAAKQSYIKDLRLKTPGTELQRDVLLTYSSYAALTDSFQNTQMEVNLPDAQVQVKDILVFAPQLRSQPAFSNPNAIWHMNIQASGNMQRLRVAALQFKGFRNTQIDAEGTLASITDPNSAGGTLTIRRLHTTRSDLELLAGPALANMPLRLPENIDVRGTLRGNMERLATNLNVITTSGSAAVDGSFTHLTNPAAATYNATVKATGLQLGTILQNPQVGTLSGVFSTNGTGFTPEAMNANFKGNIYSFGFNKYTYRNIALHGSMRKGTYNVTTTANDPNIDLDLTATGTTTGKPSLKVQGFIDSLKTLPLGFTTQPLVFRGKIDADIPSLDPKDLEADVLITQALLVSGADRLPLDSLHLEAGRTDTARFLRLTSDIVNARLSGQYNLADLGGIIQNNIQPYFSVAPYKAAQVQPYNFTFAADLIYSPILASFVPGLTAAEPIHAEGRMATGQGMQAAVTAQYIKYASSEISDLDLKVHTADSGLVVAGNIDRIANGPSMVLHKTRLNATARNNTIDFNLRLGDAADKDKYMLAGLLTQPTTGDYSLSLKPGALLLNYERWNIPQNNSILLTKDNIIANNFILQKDNQQLALQSEPGGDRPLNVTFRDFQIGTILGFAQQDSLSVNGTINGGVTLRNLMKQPVFTSDLNINNLSFKQDTLGNINAKVSSSGNSYLVNTTLTGRGNDIALTGSFAPQGSSDLALDLDLAVRRLQLNTLEGAMAAFLKQASGSINGNVSIKGTAAKPKVQGALNFDNASLTTVMIGGPFKINDEQLKVTENGFSFDNFSVRDTANNALTINGNVQTTNFINYAFSLDVDAQNFMAVNTTKKDNKLYYGKMLMNTNLHIGGTETAPIVDGTLRINEGTDFTVVLPQAEPGVQEREGVVVFTDFDAPENDSLFMQYDSLNVSRITGMDISANIEVEKKANFNLVVDAANGDFLNVQGAAQLSAGIDPSGKITLTGQYELEQGSYQLSFNFLKRRFDIQKGSKIVWLGEPTNAQVDLTAVYVANTAPLDLVENYLGDNAAQRNLYLQRLPFNVHLNMTGELMKPQIAFDIVLPKEGNYKNNTSTDIVNTVDNRLTQLRQEPSELNKQVFSLLLLNRFVGENPFQSSGSGEGFNAGAMARQSVSKLLTEQLNQLAGGLIEGVDLNFDVASSDDYTTGERRNRTDLNVGLSKRLLNDRLTVTVGSNFELEGPQQNNQRSNNIAGNVSANYQLSRDGRYMLRFYRKNEYQGIVDGYIIETGVGFAMTVDYNRFRQLIHGRKARSQGTANTQNK